MQARWLATLITLIVVETATACSGGPSADGPGSGSPASIRAYDINPVARDKVKDGGTLNWGLTDFPTQWNVNHMNGDTVEAWSVIGALMPTAFRSDEKGRISLDRDYVIRAKVTERVPHEVVTYTLNPKARWSNGKPITWRDYAAQWKAMNGRDKAYGVFAGSGYDSLRSVTKGSDDHQVVVTFAEPYGEWRSLFSPLYPHSVNASADAFNSGSVDHIPATAGPFKVSSLDTNAKTVTLVRDDAWWGNRAKLDRIVFRALQGNALVNAYSGGDLDLFDAGLSATAYDWGKGEPTAAVRQAGGRDFRQITLNAETEPLSDVRVRQAIAVGIDRKAVIAADLEGLGWPAVPLNSHFYVHGQGGYQDNAGWLGVYDPVRAGKLLDEAGWPLTAGTRKKNGKELTLRYPIPSDAPVARAEAEAVRTSLERVGVKVAIEPVSSADFFDKYIVPGEFDLTAFAYAASPYPVSANYGVYLNGTAPSGDDKKDDKKWDANLGRTGTPKIDSALFAAGAQFNQKKAATELNAADRLIWQQATVVPLFQRPQTVIVRSTLANIGATGFYDLKYADIGFTR
ncbi:ABC transporter family substrate-binding protein [Microtetraspora sp. AC03309]|uniref:ABC transporter family substrate-binding protein n=1 Tax=Microtetraspora sp. AC03309 TaxID=2779376 RepID=UPI001E42F718|nr:ABC transporter family substrate-binding protein [Microtetraspora sp. AC03309]MCC5580806.1 ABC transporter family substrate-binding protein [Microtetraspora sp. AC03309]